jgi:hypothetical protein
VVRSADKISTYVVMSDAKMSAMRRAGFRVSYQVCLWCRFTLEPPGSSIWPVAELPHPMLDQEWYLR